MVLVQLQGGGIYVGSQLICQRRFSFVRDLLGPDGVSALLA